MRTNLFDYRKPSTILKDSLLNPTFAPKHINLAVKGLKNESIDSLIALALGTADVSYVDLTNSHFLKGDVLEMSSSKGIYVMFVDKPKYCTLRSYGIFGTSYASTISTVLKVEKPRLVGVVSGKKLNIILTEVKDRYTPSDIIMENISVIFNAKVAKDSFLFESPSNFTILRGGENND